MINIKEIYTPPESRYIDTENYRRNPNMFSYITIITQVINTIFLLIAIDQGKMMSVFINLFAIISMGITGLYFKKTGKFKNSFTAYSLLALLVICYDHMVEPSYNNSNLFWLSPCLFSAFYLLDRRRAFLVAFCGLTMFTGGYLYKFYNVFPPELNTTTPDQALVINLVTMFVSSIAIYVVSRFFFQEEAIVKEKLKDLGRSNASLLSLLTHDLGSPAMVASSSLKRSRKCDRSFERVSRSLQKISDIISDTRELHALGSGKKDIQMEETKVNDILEKAIFDYSYIAEKKDIGLEFESDLSPKQSILVEPKSFLNSVLSNLISNAIKFSQPGNVVKVFALEQDGKVVIKVRDRLFDLSSPTSKEGTQGEIGTGFGLPIVKMFMDLYKGSIDVVTATKEESDDHGTEFVLKFINS